MNGLTARDVGVWRPAINIVLLSLVAATVVAIAAGFAIYDGNLVIFVAFSLVFFTIAAIAVCYPRDYAHLFLALMWFVGFWLKFVLHEVWEWPFVEPIGDFAATPANWNHVLIVCSIGGAGFIVGRLATLPLSVRLKSRWQRRAQSGLVSSMAQRAVGWRRGADRARGRHQLAFRHSCARRGCTDAVAVAAWRLVRVVDRHRSRARSIDPDGLGSAMWIWRCPWVCIVVRGGRIDVAVHVEPRSLCLSYAAILRVGDTAAARSRNAPSAAFW